MSATFNHEDLVGVVIGDMPVHLHAPNPEFRGLLEERYAGFLGCDPDPAFELDIELLHAGASAPDEDVRVVRERGEWLMTRGDFRARLNSETRRGLVRQQSSPYAIDSVLRIIHSLELAAQGGCLIHAASAIRNGRACIFAGRSGAGKTTMSRMAPPDATLLTDEISYIRKQQDEYIAYGTPFAGELARSGVNTSAPVAKIFLLQQGPENRIENVPPQEAVRSLMQNFLFFAEDSELVRSLFATACDLAARVPVQRMIFRKDATAWEMVR